ncbi:MAG: alpha/beta hydrolase [Candidatus Thorarchaeota archaeon]|nr:MAG: alpha/beta hydrolase [Candidatus Thorarchaeota archaeon]
MSILEFNGARIAYYESDDREDKTEGFPVVFVHGAGSSHAIWGIQVKVFRRSHRVITIDLSGHAASELTEGEPDIKEGFAKEVAALVEHLDLENFVLVGHSMGGAVVMAYVLNKEFRSPRAIALVNTTAELNLTKLTPGLAIEAVEEAFVRLKAKLQGKDTMALRIINEEKKMKDENPEMMLRDLKACAKFNVSERLSEIEVPTLIIHGKDDDIVRAGYAQQLEKSIKRSDIAFVKGADHQPHVERPVQFNVLLKRFLDWVDKNT